jgi:tetratricopeptide (TPR) repeat protein
MLPEAERGNDRAGIAHAYYLLDHAYTFIGGGESQRYRMLALPIYEELGDLVGQANVLNNLGVAAYIEGRWLEALDFYVRSRGARDRAGDVVGAATAANNIAEILSDQGRLDEAGALLADALRVWRAARYPVGIALATSNLGRLAARAGRFEEARRLLDDALEAFRRIGAGSFAFETEARIAELLVFMVRPVEAMDILQPLLRRMEDEHIEALPSVSAAGAWLLRLQATIAIADRRLDQGRELLARSEAEARRANAEYELAVTLELGQGVLPDAAVAAGAEVEEIRRRLGIVAFPTTGTMQAVAAGQ